jgi:hypothetical protein
VGFECGTGEEVVCIPSLARPIGRYARATAGILPSGARRDLAGLHASSNDGQALSQAKHNPDPYLARSVDLAKAR